MSSAKHSGCFIAGRHPRPDLNRAGVMACSMRCLPFAAQSALIVLGSHAPAFRAPLHRTRMGGTLMGFRTSDARGADIDAHLLLQTFEPSVGSTRFNTQLMPESRDMHIHILCRVCFNGHRSRQAVDVGWSHQVHVPELCTKDPLNHNEGTVVCCHARHSSSNCCIGGRVNPASMAPGAPASALQCIALRTCGIHRRLTAVRLLQTTVQTRRMLPLTPVQLVHCLPSHPHGQ